MYSEIEYLSSESIWTSSVVYNSDEVLSTYALDINVQKRKRLGKRVLYRICDTTVTHELIDNWWEALTCDERFSIQCNQSPSPGNAEPSFPDVRSLFFQPVVFKSKHFNTQTHVHTRTRPQLFITVSRSVFSFLLYTLNINGRWKTFSPLSDHLMSRQ